MGDHASRRRRGRETEKLVATYLQTHGFPYAQATPAGATGTDITGIPWLDLEVKARRGLDINALFRQLDNRARPAVTGVGVIRPDRGGPTTVHTWPVVLRLSDFTALAVELDRNEPQCCDPNANTNPNFRGQADTPERYAPTPHECCTCATPAPRTPNAPNLPPTYTPPLGYGQASTTPTTGKPHP